MMRAAMHEKCTSKQQVLSTRNRSNFDGPFPYFRRPKELGCFCQNGERQFVHDKSQFRYFSPPKDWEHTCFDLRYGYSQFIKRDEAEKEYLDHLLQWISLNRSQFSLPTPESNDENDSLNTDFVCWRGLLTKLLCTPYEQREGWIISVVRHRDTYFMCEYDTEQKVKERATMTERQKEMTYWGYKFEQYVSSEAKDSPPNTEEPVNNKAGFCSVVRARLNKHSIVYGGEVDCGDTSVPDCPYLELKTSRLWSHRGQENSFKRYKLIKWWAQSFLLGIEKIICGFRDDSGIVRKLQAFQTQNIPKYCRDIQNTWNPNVCFNFLDIFLQKVKEVVTENNARRAYVFSWSPNEDITCHEDPKLCFLPKWYLDDNLGT